VNYKKKFHRNLRLARFESGLSQAEFSRKMDVTRSCACQWEKNILPSMPNLFKMAKIFKIQPGDLLE